MNKIVRFFLIALIFYLVGILQARRIQLSEADVVKDIDGNHYNIVRMGDQIWMAENLRVTKNPEGKPVESFVYNDDPAVFGHLGRLYTWETAMDGSPEEAARGLAPEGWHIPSAEDWRTLFAYLEEEGLAGKDLLEGGATGFNAKLEGGADFRGNYLYHGTDSMYWSSTETNPERALHFGVNREGKLDEFAAMKGARIAIRCMKNKD